MKIKDILQKKLSFSMEIFPPRRNGDYKKLLEIVKDLKQIKPDFISVTYGAGGSTRELTREIASEIKNNVGIESMAHLTCVGNTKDEISEILDDLKNENIDNILPLRGDPPEGEEEFKPIPGGFRYASELVKFIKNEKDFFSLGVAAYPEKHPEAPSLEKDVIHLKEKVDQGADFIISQLFFNNDHFYRFVDMAAKKGIDAPILPGIFLVFSYKQLKKITELSEAEIPKKFEKKLYKYKDNPDDLKKAGIEHALKQSEDLLNSKAISGLHYYIMNRKELIIEVYRNLKNYFS